MATPAMASPGCTAANAGAFNQSVPAGTNRIQQFNALFDAGDQLFAAMTGLPLSVIVDFILGGGNPILFLNNSNGTGNLTIPTSGSGIIDTAIAAGAGGAANLVFTCTPASGMTNNSATEQSDTATNATTTSVIVENGVVNGIIDGAFQLDPTPPGPTQAQIDERNGLIKELRPLLATKVQLERTIEDKENEISFLEDGIRATERESGKYYEETFAEKVAEIFVPIDVYGAAKEQRDKENAIAVQEARARVEQIKAELSEAKADLSELERRETQLTNRLDQLPGDTNEFKPFNPTELGDGEEILFVGRDPFARALARYRGFRLDVADTGEGFSDSVKPLSFTRTLSSTIVGWVRAVYTDYEQNDASQQDGDNILVALGVHKDVNNELRIGLFATSTWGDVTSPVNNLDIDTTGYSLGAYGRYKWGEIDVNASTRIGLTDNDIAVSGTTGSYDTRLASATLGISGQEQLADNVWMRPAVSVTGTWVNREDYVNSTGTAIGGNTTWSGNVSAGPTVGVSLTPPSGFKRLEPAIGLQATYTFSDQDTQTGTVATSEDDYLSLSLSPQLSMEFDNGASLDVFGSYFGIGADLDGWSVGGTLSIPLN